MHSDWIRLALVVAAVATAISLIVTRRNLAAEEPNRVRVRDILVGNVALEDPLLYPVTVTLGITVPPVSSQFNIPDTAACTPMPFVPRSFVVYSDGVAVSEFNTCAYVPWCSNIDSATDNMAFCSDGRYGYTMTTIYHQQLAPTWVTFDEIPRSVKVSSMAIIVTATCAGRGYILDANNNSLGDLWELPDGSGMFSVVPSTATRVDGACLVHGIVSKMSTRVTSGCVLNTSDASMWWERVQISVSEIRRGLLVVASTAVLNSSKVRMAAWYHQPKFKDARVAAVCGSIVDPRTVLSGSMAFDIVMCATRRLSMLVFTEKTPSLFGTMLSVSVNGNKCKNVEVKEYSGYIGGTLQTSVTDSDLAEMHRIVGDVYYLYFQSTGLEIVVRDTAGIPRALLPARGGCVEVDGWTIGSGYDATASYFPCSDLHGECYPYETMINITGPIVQVPSRQVHAGGNLFNVPWPPYMSLTLGVESVSTGIFDAIRADSVPGLLLTEMCGSVLVYYADPLHPIMQTYFSPSGSVDPRSVGLVLRVWADYSANYTRLDTSCGMLALWKVDGNIVASPVEPVPVISGTFVCSATSRCIEQDNSPEGIIINNKNNGPVYFGGNISCEL